MNERNFCERCGKRLGKNDWDVHTCTPPTDAPPQRQWVGLTDEQKRRLANAWFPEDGDTNVAYKKALALIDEAEAKLKEKNNA